METADFVSFDRPHFTIQSTQKTYSEHYPENVDSSFERDGLIVRTATSDVPPKVEYSLSEYGQTLKPVLSVMCQWGGQHIEKNEFRLESIGLSGI